MLCECPRRVKTCILCCRQTSAAGGDLQVRRRIDGTPVDEMWTIGKATAADSGDAFTPINRPGTLRQHGRNKPDAWL